MGTVIMHNVVPVDGFIADEDDNVGARHDWYFSGGHLRGYPGQRPAVRGISLGMAPTSEPRSGEIP